MLNSIATVLAAGIYSPVEIGVTCADSPATSSRVIAGATNAAAAIQHAAALAGADGAPVFVRV